MASYVSPHRRSSQQGKQGALLPLANRFLILLIACGLLALILMTFYPEWKKLSHMRQALQKDRDELARLEKSTSHQERELYLLQHDKEYLELIARDRLDLMKPNETIFRFSPPRGTQEKKN